MKRIVVFLILITLFSCKNEEKESNQNDTKNDVYVPTLEKGEVLFQKNNCAACHKPDQKIIGPSLQEIAKIYKEQKGNMVAFLKEDAEPIVDETMYETMRINLQITKTMTDEELQSLEMYILSHAK